MLADADNKGDGARLLTKQTEEVREQRTDDATVVTTSEPAPAEAAAPVVAENSAKVVMAPKAPAAPRDQRNGVTRLAAGNKCAQIWQACDALKAQGTDITFAVLRSIVDSKIADATVRTQWSRFRKYSNA